MTITRPEDGAAPAAPAPTGPPPAGPGAPGWLLVLVFAAAGALVAADLGLEHYGIPSDEAAYHDASRLHLRWFGRLGEAGAFDEETLRQHFDPDPAVVVHPTFSRLLSGLGWALAHGLFGADEVLALRLAGAAAWALGALLLFAFAWRRWGALAAAVSLAFWAGNVRLFGHAHTAMPDLTLAVLWLAATLVLARRQQHRWALPAAAVLAGLALATKLTGGLLVLVLAGWLLFADGPRAWRGALLLLILPPAVFLLLNPQAWHHPWQWSASYLQAFGDRERTVLIPSLYLGEHYGHRLPAGAPGLHALITTPPTLLLAALVGAVAALHQLFRQGWRAVRQSPYGLFALAGLAPLVVTSLPSVPAHDVERLFLPWQPFVVLFAARGFGELADRIWAASRNLMAAALAVLLALPPVLETARQHPYELSYFNALVGGPAGAEAAGFDVAYLKLAANGQVLDALHEQLSEGESLVTNFLYTDLQRHQQAGRLAPSIRLVDRLPADWVLIFNRRGWMNAHEQALWNQPPAWALQHRGVDLLRLYRLR